MTYPLKFRRHVLNIRAIENLTYEQTSKRFKVGVATLVRWEKDIEPKVYIRVKRKLDLEKLKQDVLKYPDDYHYERGKRLGVVASVICEGLKQLGVTYKKNSVSSEKGRSKTYCL